MRILHVFADKGAENPTLDRHGDVYRFSINTEPNQYSKAVKADANHLPIQDGVEFNLGVFHPPCTKWSTMPSANKNGDAPNLIPLAREIGREYCEHYIIENKPKAPLTDPVYLTGHMFGLPIEYERAFETTFPVEQPARQDKLAETSPFYYTEKPKAWWSSVKGSSTEFDKQHLAKNTIPSAYLDHLMQYHAKAVDEEIRPDYSDYDAEMDAKRAKETNAALTEF